jgi:hypothetical protein
VPFVIVALSRQGAPIGEFEIALAALKCLGRRFLIDGKHERILGRIEIKLIGLFRLNEVTIARGPERSRPRFPATWKRGLHQRQLRGRGLKSLRKAVHRWSG